MFIFFILHYLVVWLSPLSSLSSLSCVFLTVLFLKCLFQYDLLSSFLFFFSSSKTTLTDCLFSLFFTGFISSVLYHRIPHICTLFMQTSSFVFIIHFYCHVFVVILHLSFTMTVNRSLSLPYIYYLFTFLSFITSLPFYIQSFCSLIIRHLFFHFRNISKPYSPYSSHSPSLPFTLHRLSSYSCLLLVFSSVCLP